VLWRNQSLACKNPAPGVKIYQDHYAQACKTHINSKNQNRPLKQCHCYDITPAKYCLSSCLGKKGDKRKLVAAGGASSNFMAAIQDMWSKSTLSRKSATIGIYFVQDIMHLVGPQQAHAFYITLHCDGAVQGSSSFLLSQWPLIHLLSSSSNQQQDHIIKQFT